MDQNTNNDNNDKKMNQLHSNPLLEKLKALHASLPAKAKTSIGFKPKEITVKLKKLTDDAVIPTYAHVGDVGMDLTATSVEYDAEKDMYIYHTGLAFASEHNVGQFLFVRSSNRKTDAYLCNHVGIADSAIYRGEIILCFKNRTSLDVRAEVKSSEAFFSLFSDEENLSTALKRKRTVKEDILKNPMAFAPYNVGDRIGQMVFLQYPTVKLEEVSELDETERGDGAFGSTDEQKS